MSRILIVYHTLSGNTEDAAKLLAEGVRETGNIQVMLKPAQEADSDDLLSCDGIAIGTPDYFNYMAGMLKDFFDRTFYATRNDVKGKPCVAFVTHGGGGKASDSVVRMCDTFRFEMLDGPVMVRDRPDDQEAEALRNAGRTLAAKYG